MPVGSSSPGRDSDSEPADEAALLREFGALLDRREVRALCQPVVDLNSGEIVALEALARGACVVTVCLAARAVRCRSPGRAGG